MPFTPETVYVLLEGSSVLPISGVTDEIVETDVLIYDGETYRDTINAGFMGCPRTLVLGETGGAAGGDTIAFNGAAAVDATSITDLLYATVNDPHLEESDEFTHTPPHPLEKTRTLWTFPRGTGFSHVTWGDLVQGTSPVAPYRLGMEPTPIT